MRTHAHKSRFSEQQPYIRLGYLMAYLLNSRAVKIWPGWLFLLLGLAVADASYGQGTGGTSLCSAIPETWTARPGSMSGEPTGYSYDDFGADLRKPIGGWDKYYAERIITKSDDEEVVRTIDALNDSIVSAKSKTSRDTIFNKVLHSRVEPVAQRGRKAEVLISAFFGKRLVLHAPSGAARIRRLATEFD